jgi:hypothetical protein
MGLQLQHRDKDNKWRAWTTISDGWLTGWITESEMKLYMVERAEQRFKLEAIEVMMSFPNGYGNKDGKFMSVFTGPVMDYHNWHNQVLKDYETYDEKVEAKYNELLGGIK